MTGPSTFSFEDVIERLDALELQLKRIATALETIAQTLSPEVIQVKPEGKKGKEKRAGKAERTYSSYRELNKVMKEEAPTLNENIKDVKRFKSGDFLIKIDYVDNDTFKKIAREAEAIGGEYSRKYRGFIFKGEGS